MFLLVTDSPGIILKFRDVLAQKGATATAGSPAALWKEVAREEPELIVLDLALPGLNPQAAIAQVRQVAPGARILVTGMEFSPAAEMTMLGMGIAGCCSNHLPMETVPRIIDMIVDGGVWITHAVLPLLLRELQGKTVTPSPSPASRSDANTVSLAELTPRERQIAQLVASGASNKVVARELNITDRTVKAHLGAIFQKLGTPDRLQLALYINSATRESGDPVSD